MGKGNLFDFFMGNNDRRVLARLDDIERHLVQIKSLLQAVVGQGSKDLDEITAALNKNTDDILNAAKETTNANDAGTDRSPKGLAPEKHGRDRIK